MRVIFPKLGYFFQFIKKGMDDPLPSDSGVPAWKHVTVQIKIW